MGIAQQVKSLRASRQSASLRTFHPIATGKCEGRAVLRSEVARDAALQRSMERSGPRLPPASLRGGWTVLLVQT